MPCIPSERSLGVRIGTSAALLLVFFSSSVQSQPPEPMSQPGLAAFISLDLQAKANHKCNDSFGAGLYPGNTLASLPRGMQTFHGITFQVGDGVIQLGSTQVPKKPDKVTGILVGKKFSKLHFLHATGHSEEQDRRIGAYTVHYEDGTSAMIPIAYGTDVLDWWKYPANPEPIRGKVAWESENEGAKQFSATIRLYLTTWENPHPAKLVTQLDYISAMTNCSPFCVDMTGERPLQARVVAGTLTAENLQQLWKQLAGDTDQAIDAIETFAGVPQQALPFLRARLHAVEPAVVEKRIALLIGQLDDPNITVRDKAAKELEKLGWEALPQLRWTLVKSTWLEVRHRIEPLVEKAARAKPTAEQARLQRALQIFELIGTAEARQALRDVAEGSAGAWLSSDAEASLERLQKTPD